MNVFYDATLLFFTTLSVAFMAYSMRDKFDKYCKSMGKINNMLIHAFILDPRAKMDFAKYIFEIIFCTNILKIEEMTKAPKKLLNKLYNAYSPLCSTSLTYTKSAPSGSYDGIASSPYVVQILLNSQVHESIVE